MSQVYTYTYTYKYTCGVIAATGERSDSRAVRIYLLHVLRSCQAIQPPYLLPPGHLRESVKDSIPYAVSTPADRAAGVACAVLI